MNIKALQISEERATNGVWVDYHDARLLLGSTNGAAYKNCRQKKLKQAMTANRGKLDAEQIAKLNIECLAETILLGWENVSDGDIPIVFSKAAALDLLTRVPILAEDIAQMSGDIGLFSIKQAEEAAAKLGEGSDGNSTTVATKTTSAN